jgi:hypothetical protein
MPTIVPSDFGDIDIDKREVVQVSGAAIFNPAIRARIKGSETPCILLATDGSAMLVADNDGNLSWKDAAMIQLDWRYDYKTEQWVDLAGTPLEEPEQ